MENGGLESFITIPRKVASDYRNRLLTRQERDVYVWLRMIANPYGIATIELESVAADCLGKRGSFKNYANRIMLSLKSKRYIYYEERSGRRGSFEVHLGEWPLPRADKTGPMKIKRLDKYFDGAPDVRGGGAGDAGDASEEATKLPLQGQRSETKKKPVIDAFSAIFEKESVRGPDTDTETHNKKENDTHRSDRTFKNKIPLSRFMPMTFEEQECLAIAEALEEENMAFMLGSLKKHGYLLIERAWKYCKDSDQFRSASNKGACFNSILQQFARDYQGESQSI